MPFRRNVFDSEVGITQGYSSERGFIPLLNPAEYFVKKSVYDTQAKQFFPGFMPQDLLKPTLPTGTGGSGNLILNRFQLVAQAVPNSQMLSLFEQAAREVPEVRGYKVNHVLGRNRTAGLNRFLTEKADTAFSMARQTAKVIGYTYAASEAVEAAGYVSTASSKVRSGIARAAGSQLTGLARQAGVRALSFVGGPVGLAIGLALTAVALYAASEDVEVKDVEAAQDECNAFRDALEAAYNNLEDLKLGAIKMEYASTGFCEGGGDIGRTGDDAQREIATTTVYGEFSVFHVTAYSYRGYRFSDPDQGGGIDGAMSPLNSL